MIRDQEKGGGERGRSRFVRHEVAARPSDFVAFEIRPLLNTQQVRRIAYAERSVTSLNAISMPFPSRDIINRACRVVMNIGSSKQSSIIASVIARLEQFK